MTKVHLFACLLKHMSCVFVVFIAFLNIAFGFNDDYASVSLSDSNITPDKISNDALLSNFLSNLLYSACKIDTPPLNDLHCKVASLNFGSEIFNILFLGQNEIKNIDYKALAKSQAITLSNLYFIGNQDYSIDLDLPTVSQLQWMVQNNLIQPESGEHFWGRSHNATQVTRVFYLTEGVQQLTTEASVHRIANNYTPSNCTEGIDCNLFDKKENYQFVFPQSVDKYVAGTLVTLDGDIFRCKPFPYSGFCSQWNESSTAYEPKIGAFWEMAWDYVGPVSEEK